MTSITLFVSYKSTKSEISCRIIVDLKPEKIWMLHKTKYNDFIKHKTNRV
jgi:hypothetical protein